MHRVKIAILCLALFAVISQVRAAEPPQPTQANVSYGTHPRQVLDFYESKAVMTPGQKTYPLMFFIHSGGWMSGDKARPDFLELALRSGVSVVSINYRLIPDATAAGINPPVQAPLEDAARALQFVRSKAADWKIDSERIALCGASAGGYSALWLAYHDDMADPKSSDPVSRESTRVTCVMTFVPQTTLDPALMREWISNNMYGNHAFALYTYDDFLKQREKLMPFIKANSPYSLANRKAPPTYLFYGAPPEMGKTQSDPPHSANFGVKLAEKLNSEGVECEFNYPGAPGVKHPNIFDFFLHHLKVSPAM